ncbi:hypothetical protein CRG98_017743 [Punica granatum]|uniref:Integrase catalytic domain-containing protein n=1 Tax=Punica granatum TaxID=22663 RepID=A0A2I0JZW6_PUNGR|nr:hypothetical protein CRG98_017743 [Punica granatum]
MQFGGRIGRHKVQVLVDSGASLNFISPPMAERLRLAETEQQPFAVRVANGVRLVCNRRYEGVILGVQGVEFKVILYALPVIGVEVVLGVPWLKQLGPTLMDYKEMMMEFGAEGKRHILRGAVPEGTRAVEPRSLMREVTLGAQLFMAVEARVNAVAREVAEAFVRGIVRLHGISESIVTDRDRIFMSSFWRELFKLHGTKPKMSSAYHPQIDDQTEVINRCLEQYFRCFFYHQPRLWERYLAWAEYWYNTTYQRSIAMTPFKVVYGRPAPLLVGYEPGSTVVNEVEEQLRAQDAILQELKSNLAAAQSRMKAAADKHPRG